MKSGIAGVILAGGASSRLPTSKALHKLGDKALICHVIARLRPQVDTIVICANENAKDFSQLGPLVVSDDYEGRLGPVAGTIRALQWAREAGYNEVISVPCDMPFLPSDLANRLLQVGASEHPVYAVSARGNHYGVALWPVSLEQTVAELFASGVTALRSVLKKLEAKICHFGHVNEAFLDVNTPTDLESAGLLLRGNEIQVPEPPA